MKNKIDFDQIFDALNNMQNSDEAMKKALEECCLIVENDAKRNCPVADSGLLRMSIEHTVQDNVGTVGSNIEYAPYVEYGTGLFARDGDGRKDVPWSYCDAKGEWHSTSGQNPQPYLEPSLESNRVLIQQKLRDAYQGVINNVDNQNNNS